ncbi:MAG TPA: TetR/AcrR family transcriptional regulator [Intrasporangium sp.]|uniref:TetR/AcrR family transcriptional regulator n=1 Tax=Intrasporangium sp. TaxID=1925024 RepID=UPI002D777BCA|nr:TetR/AcrR family transcriptional regulator [Intrasporangium sp.]HET7399602.1 TetR/AcrR family transcriptional regulator [Intrasporangium sp.]
MPDDTIAPARGQRLPRPERRAQLLEAALAVFVENGYHQAAMDDIAARAGVSKPVLYQHFPGKLELYLALIDRHAGELEQLVRDALSLADDKTRVSTMVRAYFDFVARDGAAFRLIFESDLANEPAVRRRLDQIVLTCAEAMADIIRSQTSLNQQEAVLVAVGFVGLAQTSARHWLAAGSGISKETATRITGALIRRGIGAFPALEREAHGGADRESVVTGAG